jgi:TusA-related sulfurtransferase
MSQPRVHRLDTTGLVCPLPVLLAARDMMQLTPGDILELVGDDPGILEDIPAWVDLNGYRLRSLEQEGERIVCRVEKTAKPGAASGASKAGAASRRR